MLITPKKFEEININQQFFETLILNGIEESQHLEYKKLLGLNQEIAKDISSFANSDGGNIIYGIEEKNHKPFKICPIKEKGIREKIDQISLDGVDPPLNIKIWPVDINLEGENGQIYVLYIPKKYPFLHFAKKNHKFYKRSNFTSTPMERFEIDLAYKLRVDISEKFKETIARVDNQFSKEYKYWNYEFRFIIYPLHFGENLFKISSEMNSFLLENPPKTPLYKEDLFLKRSEIDFRQYGYIFKSELGEHNADCIIRRDGIMIYSFHFTLSNEKEFSNLLGYSTLNLDRNDRLKRGIVFKNGRVFRRVFFIDYFLGLIGFIHKFFMKIEYFGDIKLKLEIHGALHEWVDSVTRNYFKQLNIEPIEKVYSVELIPHYRFKILKDIYNPIFNGFGIMEEDLEEFYHSLNLKLDKTKIRNGNKSIYLKDIEK